MFTRIERKSERRIVRNAVTNGTLAGKSPKSWYEKETQVGVAEVETSVLAATGAIGGGAAGGGMRTLALAAAEAAAAAAAVVEGVDALPEGLTTVEAETGDAELADRPATGWSPVEEAARWRLCFSSRDADVGVVGVGVATGGCSDHAGAAAAAEAAGATGAAPNEPDSPGSCAMLTTEGTTEVEEAELDASEVEGGESLPRAPLEVFLHQTRDS